MISSVFTWLFNLFLHHEERVQAKPTGKLPVNDKGKKMVTLFGIPVPVDDAVSIGEAVANVIRGVGQKKTAEEIVKGMGPDAIALLEGVANLIFPGAGTAIEIVSFLVSNSKPMTQEETNKWMDRFGAGSQS